jgi:hypothetical protein
VRQSADETAPFGRRRATTHDGRGARRRGLACVALGAMIAAGLLSCATWELRPEPAIMLVPADEVWHAALDLLAEREFKLDAADHRARRLAASKEIVLRVTTDRTARATTEKEHHQLDLSVRPQGDDRSLVEILYRIDKLIVEDAAFRFIGSLRDRATLRAGTTAPTPVGRR